MGAVQTAPMFHRMLRPDPGRTIDQACMRAYSNERLLFGALISTGIAAVAPALWFIAATKGEGSWYILVGWLLFTVAALVIGAIVSFLVAWPAALLFENTRMPTALGVVLCGTLAWPLLVGALVLGIGGGDLELPLLVGLGAGLGLVTSSAFVMVAGARKAARPPAPSPPSV